MVALDQVGTVCESSVETILSPLCTQYSNNWLAVYRVSARLSSSPSDAAPALSVLVQELVDVPVGVALEILRLIVHEGPYLDPGEEAVPAAGGGEVLVAEGLAVADEAALGGALVLAGDAQGVEEGVSPVPEAGAGAPVTAP